MDTQPTDPDFSLSLDPQSPDGSPAVPHPKGFRARRRNRHDRGLRGELLLPTLPGSQTRSEKFDGLVVDSAERLSELWPDGLADVEFMVEEIPDALEALMGTNERVPLGRYRAAGPDGPATVTIFRRPVESLVDTSGQLRDLVHEVIIEQVAGLLNMSPEAVDPLYRKFRGH